MWLMNMALGEQHSFVIIHPFSPKKDLLHYTRYTVYVCSLLYTHDRISYSVYVVATVCMHECVCICVRVCVCVFAIHACVCVRACV